MNSRITLFDLVFNFLVIVGIVYLIFLLAGCHDATTNDDTDPTCEPCEDGLDGFDGEPGPEGPQGEQGEPGVPGCVQEVYSDVFDEQGEYFLDIDLEPGSIPFFQGWSLRDYNGELTWVEVSIEIDQSGIVRIWCHTGAGALFQLLVVRCVTEETEL